MNDLTLNFDPFTINVLKSEFKERNGEIEMNDFIMIIKDHLIHWQLDISNRERKLIRCLYLLFNDIDLNGNKQMDWDEFTNYIIEKAAVLNTMKNKNEEIKNYHLTDIRLKKKFKQVISKCIFIAPIKRLAFFEEESDIVQFADQETGQIDENMDLHVKLIQNVRSNDGVSPPESSAKKAMLLDIMYIDDPKYNLLVTSSNDGKVRMYKYGNKGFIPADDSNQRDNELNLTFAQMVIVWDYVNEILYSGQRNGVIRIWEQKSEPQYKTLGKKKGDKREQEDDNSRLVNETSGFKNAIKNAANSKIKISDFKKDKPQGINKGTSYQLDSKTQIEASKKIDQERERKEGHDSVITALLPLPKLQFLASAALDNKIILWDLLENAPKRVYKGYHNKGIVSLSFNESLILLISGGFDHEIFVWNPYIDSPVHKLSGHAAPIVGLSFVPNPLHIISVDRDCVMKVWDTKKFKCIDSLTLENMEDRNSFRVQGICVVPNPLKVVIMGKNIYAYGYDKNNSLSSADENVSLCARFVAGSLSLLTPVGNKVKLWNLLTGEIKKIFSDLSKTDIASLVLDTKGKRFIMGDMDGNVGVYNVTNGALLKSLTKHKSEIISIIHAEGKPPSTVEYIISASIDNNIKIHDDKELGESKLMTQLNIKDCNITSMIYEKGLGKLIIGCSTGVITLFETATGKGNEEFSDKDPSNGPESEVTSIAFFKDVNSLIFSNAVGKLKIVALPPLQVKHEIIYTFTNLVPKTSTVSSVYFMVYCGESHKLFCADEKFYLKCYDIRKVIDHIKEVASQTDKAKRAFKITSNMIVELWCKKPHDETIRSLEYIPNERLLVTTSMDKCVKISSSDNGYEIESLKQSKGGNKIKPIAYKKVESNEIYTPRMEHRIDTPFVIAKEKRERDIREMLEKQERGVLSDTKIPDELIIESTETIMDAFKEYEEQEFNPYHYTSGKIHRSILEGKRSNEWNLRIKFENYFREFEDSINQTSEEVDKLENKLLQQKDEEEKNPKLREDQPVIIQDRAKKVMKSFKDKFISKTDQDDAKLREQIEIEGKKKLKKASNKTYESLYKQGLKQSIVHSLFNEKDKVKLSENEKLAAENLAKAFSNIDEHDPRVLRFTDYELRKEKKAIPHSSMKKK